MCNLCAFDLTEQTTKFIVSAVYLVVVLPFQLKIYHLVL